MAFIRPILEYGDVVQIEAARIITGLRVNPSKSILYHVHSELGWETLQSRRNKH